MLVWLEAPPPDLASAMCDNYNRNWELINVEQLKPERDGKLWNVKQIHS